MTPEERKRDWAKRQRQKDWARRRAETQPQPVAAPAPAPESPGFFEAVKVGAASGYQALTAPIESAADIVAGLATGDTRPLKEVGKRLALGVGQYVAPPGSAPAFDAAINQARGETAARRLSEGDIQFLERERRQALVAREEAKDPSLRGRITRGVVSAGVQSLPYLAAAPGGIPALAATGALSSLNAPENLLLNVGLGAAPLPVGQAFKAGINTVRRMFGKGAAQIIEAEATPAAVAQVGRSIPEPPGALPAAVETVPVSALGPAVDPLQSVFGKLGTDNIEQIGAMIANANRRLGKKRTPEQIRSSLDDYNALRRLTPEENQALGRVLPMRNVAPVVPDYAGTGPTARDVQNIPMSEFQNDPQLAANLRHAMGFFDEQGRALQAAEDAAIMGDIGPGAFGAQIAQPARVGAADLITSPPGPRVTAETGPPAPSTAAPTPAPSVIGDRIRTMVRTPDSPVLVGDVRRQFPGVGKKEFDDEMIRLVEDGQIALHRHDAPGQLTAAERDAMVKIGKDYYTAATVRGPQVSAPLDAMTVSPAGPGGTILPPPPGDIPTGFGDLPPGPQTHLFDYAPSLSRLSHVWQRAKDELFGALGASKSMTSSGDISYPFRQGLLLQLRPLQWRQAKKVWENSFKGFKTKNFEEIKQAVEVHPLAKRMNTAELQIFPEAGEEAFARRAGSKISEVVQKAPGIKQSQQAYTAGAVTQRVQAFEQYARAIDKAGLSTAEALKADKAAAEWINIATGRGSLGQRLERALDALNVAFFSPRYVASRINILNPAMYIRNASSPGGRVVLRQQMADLAQFTGVVATTLYLAKQAGADVNLSINSPDFLKIRIGNHRYDTLAGLQQVMRAGYRISDALMKLFRGEKPKYGESAKDIASTFLQYKLAPPASVFNSFLEQRFYGGKDFTAGRAAAQLVAPMQWADFVDAWRDESFGGALMSLPGGTGIGHQYYEFKPLEAALDRNRPLLSELQRLDTRIAELQRGKDKQGKPETDDQFNARVQQFGQNYTSYGLQLIQHPRFQIASDEVKTRALKRLNEKAKGLTHKEFGFAEIELDPGLILDSVEK